MKISLQKIILSSLILSPALAQAQVGEMEKQMLRCSVLGDPSARLGCFDALSKAADNAQTVPAAGAASTQGALVPVAADGAPLVPKVAEATPAPPESPISRTVSSTCALSQGSMPFNAAVSRIAA